MKIEKWIFDKKKRLWEIYLSIDFSGFFFFISIADYYWSFVCQVGKQLRIDLENDKRIIRS